MSLVESLNEFAAVEAWLDEEKRALYESSLAEFLIGAWPNLDPGTPFVYGHTIDAICDHLQAVDSGHITRLLITVPPGTGKSWCANVAFPVWSWLRRPYLRFICASYSEGLTRRDNDRCRRLINSEWFQDQWADRFQLISPNQVNKFDNDKSGWKLATSVGGQLLGWRASCLILDDPNSPDGEDSTVRESTRTWFKEVVPTRLENADTSSIVVIQQRLHLEDVAGTALSSEYVDWVHLNLPMEYEPRRYVNGYRHGSDKIETFFDDDCDHCEEVFWEDWREVEGELLWPERFSPERVRQWKGELGPTMASAALQQRPIPRGGSIIKSAWWKMWPLSDPRPPFEFLLASVDTAYTKDKTNDPSAMTVWGVNHDEYGNPRIFMVWAWQDWLELHDLVEFIIDVCQVSNKPVGKYPRFPVHKLLIERAASGISVADEIERLIRQKATFGIEGINPRLYGGDKVSRLQSIEHVFANGMVYTSDRDWADKVIQQCASIPYTRHDDLADTVAQAIRWLRDCGYMPIREEAQETWLKEREYRPRLPALYPV